ncbi:uncharacterized Fe-S protein [Desulfosporosinus orientis DSM 765]|uniref:Uncharacterized Fe-S protein n=1 Tax=Desulfosporosinus orientis (strain ATCC 19365 / DSM 765 / NCIMB 8382 / VKM B-1628 / Singapore I) TaxID=768706 RepID=G7WIP1_DESOD|nr:tRNA epoxyqueuosine(34) reductase QueG [Desulfosporosinus orientis]AET69115.1 uncharacterized Fe-S protein [Desulfosporosinus orientis DSM 765]
METLEDVMDLHEQIKWKEDIKRWAREGGFAASGFTTADPVESLRSVLKTRIDQGIGTPFESQDIKERIDPRALWQECSTVIALAYPFPLSLPPEKGEGILARSAAGDDYHHVVTRKIRQLMDLMIQHDWPGSLRFQVDTGPLIERAFAVRAGIGWIGRNQHLIIPGYGSFVALALLLLDQEIPGDEPLSPGQCGACQRCIRACPARILGREPFNSKRCVSYLTQSKEVLTLEERQRLGLRIFGCDTCQEVCPHNQQWLQEERKSPLRRGVNLKEILNLSKGEFLKEFKHTAAGWRGKGVLQRNAYIALQNAQDSESVQILFDYQKNKTIPPSILPYVTWQEHDQEL